MPSITSPDESLPSRPDVETVRPPEETGPVQHAYRQILKSSVVIGGSSVVNICLRIVRAKVMAMLLGPAGVGLMGLYSSVADLTQSIAGMGINSSGVRQIAEAVGTGETQRIARTATVLRRVALLLGLLGGGLLVLFSRQVSTLTFGSYHHAGSVALLAIAVFFSAVSGGQSALIQGVRHISDLARMSILGALFGTLVGIPLVYFLRENGLVPLLVAAAAMSAITSWWYSRKVEIQPVAISFPEVRREVALLLKLGFAFMASGLLTMGAAYIIRIIIVRERGFEAAGLYQAAWGLGGLYVGFILQAMGTDFYPRLTAACKDNGACNRLVNEQAHISLLLAGPGLMATLTFAPILIALFYSGKFAEAVAPLRWICLGLTLRVVAWPMGFIILAKGAQNIFFLTELAATAVHVGLAWLCVHRFGVTGAGVAFFGLYAWHTALIYIIVRLFTGFRWSAPNRKTGLAVLSSVGLVFCGFLVFSNSVATVIGSMFTGLVGIYSLRRILILVPDARIPKAFRRFITALRLTPATA